MPISENLFSRCRTWAVYLLRSESIILIALIIYLALLDALRTKPLSAPLALAGDFIALAAQLLHVLPNGRPGHIELLAHFLTRNIPVAFF